jgi:hypothetical protein
LCGAVGAGVWLLAFGLQSVTLRGYLSWIGVAGGVAWLAAVALARSGNRGVAVGIAAAVAVAWSIAGLSVLTEWFRLGVWPV